jgi:hypothetical protein
MEFSIINDGGVKYTRYYIYEMPKDFKIPAYFPRFFEGDKENRQPLTQAKAMLKAEGATVLNVFNNGKTKTYNL